MSCEESVLQAYEHYLSAQENHDHLSIKIEKADQYTTKLSQVLESGLRPDLQSGSGEVSCWEFTHSVHLLRTAWTMFQTSVTDIKKCSADANEWFVVYELTARLGDNENMIKASGSIDAIYDAVDNHWKKSQALVNMIVERFNNLEKHWRSLSVVTPDRKKKD